MSDQGSYGEDFDNNSVDIGEKLIAAVEAGYNNDCLNDKPESDDDAYDDDDEEGITKKPSLSHYEEDFENENSSAMMKTYGFTMSASLEEISNENDSSVMLRAPPDMLPQGITNSTCS